MLLVNEGQWNTCGFSVGVLKTVIELHHSSQAVRTVAVGNDASRRRGMKHDVLIGCCLHTDTNNRAEWKGRKNIPHKQKNTKKIAEASEGIHCTYLQPFGENMV